MKVYVAVAMWNPDDVRSEEAEAGVVGVARNRADAARLVAQDIINDMTGDVEDEDLPDVDAFAEEIEQEFKSQRASGRWDYSNSYTEFRYMVELHEVQ